MPPIQDTIGSPKQWGYRTKITPHFDAAPKVMQASLIAQAAERKKVEGGKEAEEEAMNGVDQTEVGRCGHVKEDIGKEEGRGTKTVSAGERNWELRIGFERKGRPGVMDIEVSLVSSYAVLSAICKCVVRTGLSLCHVPPDRGIDC